MTCPPIVRAVRLVLPLLAVLLPVGADPVPPSLSQVLTTPASAGTPPSFSGIVNGGPPNGTARLQASVDMGVADPWANIATATLDNLGTATFSNISDSRPHAAASERDFFRVVCSSNAPLLGTMIFIPGGTFQMGDALDGLTDAPVHSVYVSGFYLQNTEVTKAQWDEVRAWGLNNGYTDLPVGIGTFVSKGANHPVLYVTWYDVVKHCNARSQMEGLAPCYTVGGQTYKTSDSLPDCDWSASGYRLPTEAEWEKAARGGLSGKRFPWGDAITHLMANYRSHASYPYDVSATRGYHPTYNDGVYAYTSPVGSFPANGYGLYDMAGNVWEWCWDWYESSYQGAKPSSNPRGPVSGSYRIHRSGNWAYYANFSRTAYRNNGSPGVRNFATGFRPARSVTP